MVIFAQLILTTHYVRTYNDRIFLEVALVVLLAIRPPSQLYSLTRSYALVRFL